MRIVLALALTLALAVPAVAIARGSGSSAAGAADAVTTTAKKGKKAKQAARLRAARSTHADAARRLGRTGIVRVSHEIEDDDEVEVTGAITVLRPLTVAGVSCFVPAGRSLGTLAVGDVVEMTCDRRNDLLILRRVKREDVVAGKLEVTGPITSLSPLTVAGVSCVLPVGRLLGPLAVGDVVELKCRLVNGQWIVRELELEDDDHSGPGGGDDDDDDDDHSGPGGGDDD